MSIIEQRVKQAIREVQDFPAPGIGFKDITPVLSDAALFRDVIMAMSDSARALGPTHVVGIESRGFLFGVPMAMELALPFVPARKPGKLPGRVVSEAYALEYRSDVLELHADALDGPSRVLVVDDVLATGGTAAAACRLVERAGGTVVGVSVLVELAFLQGRSLLPGRVVQPMCRYD